MADDNLNWDDTPDIENQTSSYFKRGAKTLWKLTQVERKRLTLAVGILLFCEGLGLLFPLIMGNLLELLPTIASEYDEKGIPNSVIILACSLFVLRYIIIAIRRTLQEPIFLRGLIRLENFWPMQALHKLLDLSVAYHDRENTGRKIAKVNKGTEKMVGMLADIFWQLSSALIYLTFNALIIFYLDWRLALLFFLPLIPAVWINLRSYRKFYPMWEQWEKKKEESIGLFCQSIINVRTVQAFVSEKREASAHDKIRLEMQAIDNVTAIQIQWYFMIMEMILWSSFTATLVVGMYLVCIKMGSIATVVYIAMTGNVTLQSLQGMIQVYTRMLRDLIAAERMDELLSEKMVVENSAVGTIPEIAKGDIQFKNVSLLYPGKGEPVLRNFNLDIFSGELLALVGKSGSGKSTLVSLLSRVYDVTSGSITLDGIDIKLIDRGWYRSRFAFVPQDVEIFDGTIEYNIKYAFPEASQEWVAEAIAASSLDEIVNDPSRFPLGLATQVGERGVRLSGGERQRVGIARAYIAILNGAPVLVLDEATSSLDSVSESIIRKVIEKIRKERNISIIVIAHRLSTIYTADRICVLDKGEIVEMGDHNTLLKQNGLYHQLVQLQDLGELRE